MLLAHTDTRNAPILVLLHGFPFSREMWDEQIQALGGSYRIIAPDLRGHGASEAPEGVHTMDEMADDVIGLLDHLEISEPVVLGGLSMGGYVALSIVARHPGRVRALILMDTKAAPDSAEAAANREKTARQVLEDGQTTGVVETMAPRLFSKSTLGKQPQRVAKIVSLMSNTTPQGVAGALRGMAVRPDRRPDLARIKVPTLVIAGEDDVISPPAEARQIAEAIPGAQVEIVPGAGHLAPFENPVFTNDLIVRFLKSLETSETP